MSPLPISFSAPIWSRMTRLSASVLTENARRLGMLALITPVITSTDGRCVAITRWMPTARAICAEPADARLDVTGRDHHEVGQLVDDHHDEGQTLVGLAGFGIGIVGGRQVALVEHRVVTGDVAHADVGEDVVAHLHLAHGPVERVRGALGVRHHFGEEVRHGVVLAELDALRVDEDQAHLIGRGAHEQRRDDAVDAARLARHRSGRRSTRAGTSRGWPSPRCPRCRGPSRLRADASPSWPRDSRGCRRASRSGASCWGLPRRSRCGRESAPGCERRDSPLSRRFPWRGW